MCESIFRYSIDSFPYPPVLCQHAGAALSVVYGESARAAMMNVSRNGWCEANVNRTRPVLRNTTAPILSSLKRMVAAQARSSSVLAKASAQALHEGTSIQK